MPDIEYEAKLFEDRAHGTKALERLQALGYGPEQLSLIIDERDLPADQSFESDSSPLAARGMSVTGVAVGGAAGGVIGAIVAAAASIAIIALTEGAAAPFLVGPLAAAIGGFGAGVVGGTIVGGLLELGLEADDWKAGLRNGGIVIIAALNSPDDRDIVRKALMG